MKVKEKSFILCVLECICHTALIYPILTVIWYLFVDNDCINLWNLCVIAISEVLLYCIRRRIHNSLLFIGVMIVYLAGLFLLENIVRSNIFYFIGIVMVLFCLAVGFSGKYVDLERPNGGLAGLIIFVGICVWLTDSPKLLLVFYICEAVYVMSLIIYNNLERANKFIWENRRTAFLYVSQIRYANYLITTMLVVLTLAVSSICSVIFTPVLNLTREPLLNMIKSFMNYDFDMPDLSVSGVGGGEPETAAPLQEDSDGSALQIILYIIAAAAVVFFIIVFIIFIVKIIKNLSISSREGDIKEYILPSSRNDEISSVDKGDKEETNGKPAKAIRKIYKKKIKSNLKKGSSVGKATTPNEQMNMAGLKGEPADKFADLYRKARYGNEECSEQDVEEMKSLR